MNKPNIQIITLATFQVSKMDLTTFLAKLVFTLRLKLLQVVIRGIDVFQFWGTFFKTYFCEAVILFSWPVIYNQLLTMRMPMATKHFRLAARSEELSSINMHDTSMEWSCGIT